MLTGLAALLLFFVAVLSIPATLTFRLSWQQLIQHEFEVEWAFGLVRIRIPSLQAKAPPGKNEGLKQNTGRARGPSRKKRNLFSFIRQRKFRRRMMTFTRDLWRAVHKRDVRLHVRVGLGDPADTGRLWGIVGPAAGLLANIREASITIEPDFLDTTFELDSSGSVRVVPLRVIYLVISLLLSPVLWQGMRELRMSGR